METKVIPVADPKPFVSPIRGLDSGQRTDAHLPRLAPQKRFSRGTATKLFKNSVPEKKDLPKSGIPETLLVSEGLALSTNSATGDWFAISEG